MSQDLGNDGPTWLPSWSRAEGEQRATALLRDVFNAEPDRVTSAPGMVTIIGEHTDYNAGVSMPTVAHHRAFVTARCRDDDLVRIVSDHGERLDGPGSTWEGQLDAITKSSTQGWPSCPASVVWALQERGYAGRGFDIAIASCVPPGAGMSSSAAVNAAVALAVNEMWGLALGTDAGRTELAQACIDGEAEFSDWPSAGLDLHAVLRCEEGEGLLLDFDEQPPAGYQCPLYFPDYGLALVMIDTGIRPDGIAELSRQRRAECAQAAAELGVRSLRELEDSPPTAGLETLSSDVLRNRVKHVLAENERVRFVMGELSGTGPAHERFVAVGKAMYRSHTSLDVDYDLSSPALNAVVDAAFQAGALGARLTGWGRGGSVLALMRRAEAARTASLIDQAVAAAGLPTPTYSMV